jgi:hypothetical protein
MNNKTKKAFSVIFVGILLMFSCQLFSQKEKLEYVDSLLWSKAHDVKIKGDYAYCAFLNGLKILDVSNKRKPAAVSQLYLGGGYGIEIIDTLALVAAGEKGLQIVDIANVKTPDLKGTYETPGEAKAVAAAGKYVYVAAAESGLQVINISDPAAPELAGAIDTPGSAEDVIIRGDYAFIADGSSGLQIINISNPLEPKAEGRYDTPDNAERVAVSGDYAFIADGSSGLQIINVSVPSEPKLAASFYTSGYAHGVTVRGDYAYIGNLYDGAFQIVDISDPLSPVETALRKYTMYNEAWDVTVEGEYAYVVDFHCRTGPAQGKRTVFNSGFDHCRGDGGRISLCCRRSFRPAGDRP